MRRAALLFVLFCAAAPAATPQSPQPRVVLIDSAKLRARRLTESSGVIESRKRPGVFWTLNDSGDRPRLYATDSVGTDLGRIELRGARSIDWEDLTIGLCPSSPGDCLYVGDIGDNDTRRRTVTVYAVPEPEPPSGPGDTLRITDYEATIELRYPDRPHNAEAMVVLGRSLMLVTKDRSGPATLMRARVTPGSIQVLERVADLAMETSFLRGRVATAAALSGDRRWLVVRTYVSIHVFDVRDSFAPLTVPSGLPIPIVEAQGEGICFDHVGRLVITSEGGSENRPTIARVALEGLPQ